jgi:hypothetical protein
VAPFYSATVVYFYSALDIPLNIFMEFVVPALAVPFLILFKYGKPRGYIADLLRSFVAPHDWCALERDSELTAPYIIEEE